MSRRAAYYAVLTSLTLLGLAAFPAGAQPTNAPEAQQLKPVLVTGSLIPTAETVGATPVEVISAAKLEQAGVTAPEQIAKILPSAIGAGNFGSSRGNGGDGSSSIALRGIPGGTLVLMNGRRLAPNSFFDGSTVDLNTIPLAAVERVEILKDGGSAIYGADAIAGVVNFIMKKNFSGTQIGAYYGNTTEKDAASQNYSFITAMSDDKSSFLVGGSYYEQNALYSKDRDRSRADLSNPGNTSGTSNPGRFDVRNDALGGGQLYDPYSAADEIVGVRVRDDAVPDAFGRYTPGDYRLFELTDRFPYPNYTPAIRPAERYYFFANGDRQLIGDALKFFAEGSYAHTWTYNQLAPTPFNTAFSPATIGANNFYNPWGVDLDSWAYRTAELGPRSETIDGDTFRIVTGFRGNIPDSSISWETGFLYARDRRQQTLDGDFSYNSVLATMDRDTPDAFNPFGNQSLSSDLLTEIAEPLYTLSDQQLGSVDLVFRGDMFEGWAGPVGFAAGGQYAQEKLDYQPDYPQRSGDLVGFNQDAPLKASRDIASMFGEVNLPLLSDEQNVPLVHNLEVNVALRYDDYDDFGDTTNPKISLRWQPLDKTLTLRGTYSTSFKAPTFSDLYTQPSEDFPELRNPVVYNDPNRGPNDPYAFTQVRTLRQGNPDLEPEEAENFTAGFVWSPEFIKNFTMAIDWYHIKQENVPDSVDQFIIDQNYAGGGPFDPNAPYASLIVADPNSPEIYQLLYSPTLNLSERVIEGIDFSLRYDIPTEKAGTFALGWEASYVYKYEQENIPGEGFEDRLGRFVDPSQGFGLGTIPQWKFNASCFWSFKGFEAGVTFNYISEFEDDTAAIGYERMVDSILTIDLQASYTILNTKYDWANNTKFTVGCINVTDEEPPLVEGAFADNYDRDTHDLRGRFLYVSLSKMF
jgi:outer membrane receptor protein involved in Fe transport